MSDTTGWLVEWRTGSAQELHLPWPDTGRRHIRALSRCEVTLRPTLVLGSSQPDGVVDVEAARQAGVDVVHRRSGGGAVLVGPGAQLWIEAWVPRRDALWDDDVVRGAFWFGDVWAAALAAVGAEPSVHRGRATVTEWSSLVCFAGVGPGEVTVGDRKMVGLSQRRSAAGTRLQTLAVVRWDPHSLLELLDLSGTDRVRGSATLAHAAEGLAALGSTSADPSRPAACVERLWGAVVDNLPFP